MEKLKVVCISNSRLVKSLTIGQIYDVGVIQLRDWHPYDETQAKANTYYTINDNLYSSDDFITIDEWRNKQLNQLI